jgi:hypothetical protein
MMSSAEAVAGLMCLVEAAQVIVESKIYKQLIML